MGKERNTQNLLNTWEEKLFGENGPTVFYASRKGYTISGMEGDSEITVQRRLSEHWLATSMVELNEIVDKSVVLDALVQCCDNGGIFLDIDV